MKRNSLPLRARGAAILCAALALNATVSAGSLFKFNFDEGSGGTVESESGSLTGTLGRPVLPDNYPIASPDSPSGEAGDMSLRIVDPDGYLLMDATDTEFYDLTEPLTVEAWINVPSSAAPRAEGIIGFGGTWKLGFMPDGRLAFTLFGAVDAAVDIYPDLDVWTHVAIVFEPGVGIRFFRNGAEFVFLEETRPLRAPVHNFLGIGSGGTGEPIDAAIDRVRVHQAALTAEELDSVAAEPKPVLASTLTAFDFDEAEPPYRSTGIIQEATQFAQDVYVANSAPVFTSASPSGQEGDQAVVFDGNDRIIVADLSQEVRLDTGDFTMQAWVKPGAQPGAKGVVFYNNGPGGAVALAITQDRHVMVTTLGLADSRSEAVVPDDGVWHHVGVIHRNGQDLRFFVDGVLQDTLAYDRGVLMDTRTETAFTIGSESNGGLAYNGSLDRLEYLNEALAPADLDSLAIPGVIPDAPELEIATAVSISWPAEAAGFVLQSTTDLNEPRTWTDVNASPEVIDGKAYVLLPAQEEETFYRLIRPAVE